MAGEKKIAVLLLLVLVILSLGAVATQPLTYRGVDWVSLGYQVYSGKPPEVTAPPIYLPYTAR